MSVSFSAGTGLLFVGIFLLLLIIPGFTDIISDLFKRQVRSVWRSSTKYSLAIIGTFLISIGLFIILKAEVSEAPIQAQVPIEIIVSSPSPQQLPTETLTPFPSTQAQLPTETLTPSPPTKWYVRVHNIDDIGTVYVNDHVIASVGYSEDSGWIEVTSYFLGEIQNRVRFTLKNNETGYRWGFAVMRNEIVIWQDREGQINQGARNDDFSHTFQIVYDKTLLISQDGQVTIQP